MQTRKQRTYVTCVLATTLLLGTLWALCPAAADDTASTMQSQIDGLKQTINDLQTRLADLEKQAKTVQSAQPKAGENAVTAKSKLKIEGYGQIRYTSDGTEAGVDQLSIRRMRMTLSANVTPQISAKTELKLEGKQKGYATGSQVQVRQFYFDYALPNAKFRAGRCTIPFGYEVQTSSSKLWSGERSLMIDKLFPDLVDNGVQYVWNVAEDKPTLAVGLFNGVPSNSDDENNAKDPMVSYNMPFKNGGVILSYYNGTTGTSGDEEKRDRAGIGAKLEGSKLAFMGEIMQGDQDGSRVNGWYSQLGLKTTKSSMLFAKYDQYDEDTSASNDLFKRTTVGWFKDIDPYTRLTLSYELRRPQTGFSDFDKYDGNVGFVQWQVCY